MFYAVVVQEGDGVYPNAIFRGSYAGHAMAIIPELAGGEFDDQYIIKPATKDVEKFMTDLKRFDVPPFAWRQTDGALEIAVHLSDKGWWIGNKGRRVKAVESHLRMPVRFVAGRLVINLEANGVGRKIVGAAMLSERELCSAAFCLGIRDTREGREYTHGYCAPWNIPAVS